MDNAEWRKCTLWIWNHFTLSIVQYSESKNVSEARIISILRWRIGDTHSFGYDKKSQYWFRVRYFLSLTNQSRVGASSVFYLRKETVPVSEKFSIWILDNGKSQITRLSRVLRNTGRIVKNLQLISLYFICCPVLYTTCTPRHDI
jgi:hypothetical protein